MSVPLRTALQSDKRIGRGAKRRALPGIAPEPASMTVNEISLMRSDRGRNGMIYTELGTLEADGK